ncbi:MAG TPA: hypothetical protein VH186_02405 [Chloroflexia bacterium]|nr:hypothetical protein [Chloroflexia bacterium]
MLLVRFLQSVIVLSVLGIVLVLFQAGATSSGQVIFAQDYRAPGATEAITFDNPETLRVFQSSLQPNRPDYYAFHANKGQFLKVVLNTLRLPGYDSFRPALLVFGPGLPPPTPDETNKIPFTITPGAGLIFSEPDKNEATPLMRSDEPWTQASYWERQSIVNQIPETGLYYLAVFGQNGQSGKYALTVGETPEAGLQETITFPVTWARVHYWFDDYWWPTFAAVVVGLLLLGLILWYLRAIRRAIKRMAVARASARRSTLLARQRQDSWDKRRVRPTIRTAEPFTRHKTAKPVAENTSFEIKPAFEEPEPIQAEAEGDLLLGPKWEMPGAEISPESIKAGTNGHIPVNQTAGFSSNGHTEKKDREPDGLTLWGQRLRPASKSGEEKSSNS